MTWEVFVNTMRGSGVNIAVGILWYLILDWYPPFKEALPRLKRVVAFLLCMAIPLLATLAAVLTLGVPANDWANTWFPALVAGGTAFSTSTLIHTRDLPVTRTPSTNNL